MEAFSPSFLDRVPASELVRWLQDVTRILTASTRTVNATESGVEVTYADVVVTAQVEDVAPHRFTALALGARDWASWHDAYENPQSSLSRRLRVVQRHISRFLDTMPMAGCGS